jgi:hypothetical protein
VLDALLVDPLVLLECLSGVVAWMVVDEFVTGRAEEHQVRCIVDAAWSTIATPRPLQLERDNVSGLAKISRPPCDSMLEKIFVAAIELAAPASFDVESQANGITNASPRNIKYRTRR